MINKWGEEYYDSYSQGLNAVFGEFILCSDNFCIERRDKSYKLPSHNLSRDEYNEMENEYKFEWRDKLEEEISLATMLRLLPNYTLLKTLLLDLTLQPIRDGGLIDSGAENVHIIFDGPIEPGFTHASLQYQWDAL